MPDNRREIKRRAAKQQDENEQLVETFCRTLLKTAKEEQKTQLESSEGFSHGSADELLELFYLVLSRFKYILLAAVLSAILFGVYAFCFVQPVYSSTAKLYIMGQNSSSILADLQIGSYLTMDYQEVFKTWEVHEMVRKQLNLPYTYKEMQSMLTVSNPSDTRVLYITVKNEDPQEATDIANAYAESAKKFILETMDSEEPSTFSLALVPGSASGRSRTSYIVIGLFLGTFAAIGIIVLKALLDNRPKTPDDIAKSADIPTLAIVPSTKAAMKGMKNAARRNK